MEDDGTVVCLSDSTPVYPEGEEWEVEPENLRAGHPQEALGFGMLNAQLAPPAFPKSAWRSVSCTVPDKVYMRLHNDFLVHKQVAT